MPNSHSLELWMDSKQYASLSKEDKAAVAAAIEMFDIAVAAAKKQLADTIADITDGKLTMK